MRNLDDRCTCGHTGWFHDSYRPYRCNVGSGSLLADLCPCREFAPVPCPWCHTQHHNDDPCSSVKRADQANMAAAPRSVPSETGSPPD